MTRRSTTIEIFIFLFCALFYLFLLHRPLFLGISTYSHDNFYWNFPLFSYYADCLRQGFLPLWNPYSHAGEPFYPVLGQMRLYEPLTLLTVWVGKYFTENLVLLFNWHRAVLILHVVLGSYLVLRRYATCLETKILLIPALFFSSFTLSSMRSDAIVSSFLWAPYIAYFLLKLLQDADMRWKNWLGLAISLGLNWQSYFFAAHWLFFGALALGLGLRCRGSVQRVLLCRAKVWVSIAILLLLLVPMLVTLIDSKNLVYPIRFLPADYKTQEPLGASTNVEGGPQDVQLGVFLPYSAIEYAGTFATVWDYWDTLSYAGNPWIRFAKDRFNTWGGHSETYLYLGILPWIVVLLGLFFGLDSHKRIWGFITLFFALLTLGSPGVFHRIAYYLLPPLWFVRHTAYFTLYVQLGFLYFLGLGFNRIFSYQWRDTSRCAGDRLGWYLTFSGVLSLVGFLFLRKTMIDLHALLFAAGVVYLIVLCLFRKHLGRWQHIGFILLFQLGVVFFFLWEWEAFALRLILAGALFFVIYFYFMKNRIHNRSIIIATIGMLTIGGDLGMHYYDLRHLYEGTLSPYLVPWNVPRDFDERVLTSKLFQFEDQSYEQRMRYSELMTRERTIFSPARTPYPSLNVFEQIRKGRRWDNYYLFKTYYDLIHSRFSDEILQRIFRQGKSLWDLKPPPSTRAELTLDSAPGDIHVVQMSPNKAVVTVKSSSPVLLYRAEGWDRYWNARVNGQMSPILRVNHHFQGVVLGAGRSFVEFCYAPTPFLWAIVIFYGLVVGVGTIFSVLWFSEYVERYRVTNKR